MGWNDLQGGRDHLDRDGLVQERKAKYLVSLEAGQPERGNEGGRPDAGRGEFPNDRRGNHVNGRTGHGGP
ncbi:MAG: hypothetical protein HON70_12580 [Lentisphaerae bacterium]|nr:hypothetical protein [Lentisphaerota bacterium]